MSYTKLATSVISLVDVQQVLQQQGVNPDVAQGLMDASAEVQLDDGSQVWVSCVMNDNPMTPQIDFITVSIAVRNGFAQIKPNGQYVCVVFWHGVMPDSVPVLGVSTIRKALMMIALGEPQPTIPVTDPQPGQPTEVPIINIPYTADRCIKTYIGAAAELSAPLEDVL